MKEKLLYQVTIPHDREVKERIPICSPCESCLNYFVLYVTFDYITRQRLKDLHNHKLIDLKGYNQKERWTKLSDIKAKGR